MAALKESWKEVQRKLTPLSKTEIFKLVGDLYETNNANRRFIAARFIKGEVSVKKYKQQIYEALYPDFNLGDTDIRIADARKAISDFKKASGDSKGTIDLMIYFLEIGNEMIEAFGMDYGQFYDRMESMFRRVTTRLMGKDRELQPSFMARLRPVVAASAPPVRSWASP